MKQKTSFLSVCLLLFVMLVCNNCGIFEGKPLTPFTELDFDSTVGDMLEAYGETNEININEEEGLTEYFYPYEHEGRTGQLRFSVNSEDKIERISWIYQPSAAEEVVACAEEWGTLFTDTYGEPDFENPAGKVWYTPRANIGIFRVSILSNNIVRIMFYPPAEQETSNVTQ